MHTALMSTAGTSHDLLGALRGRRERRPRVDPTLAGGLRAWIEDDLAPLVGEADPAQPLFLSPRAVVSESLQTVPPLSALARSALLSALLAQRVVLGSVVHPMDDALSALEADPGQAALVDAIHSLDPDGFAQLAAELTAHYAVLAASLTSIPGTWLPRTNVRLSVPLAGGRVVLGAVASLVMGPPADEVSTVCLLDVTTSSLDPTAQRRLGILSLLETLRSGAAPLRVGSLSTATGEVVLAEVTDELLRDAIADVVSAVAARKATP